MQSIVSVPHITESSTDTKVIIPAPIVNTNVTCRLNDRIPSSVTTHSLHNGGDVTLTSDHITMYSIKSMDAAVLQIRDFHSSDFSVYQCVFNNTNPATGVWSVMSKISIKGTVNYHYFYLHQK